MNNNKFKFRTPWYLGDKFAGFQYWEFEHGQVKLIGDYWEPWVSKRDELTAKPDEQCTGLEDLKGKLIYVGDNVRVDAHEERHHAHYWHNKPQSVEFGGSAFRLKQSYINLSEFNSKRIELIGNIHEQAKQKDE